MTPKMNKNSSQKRVKTFYFGEGQKNSALYFITSIRLKNSLFVQ